MKGFHFVQKNNRSLYGTEKAFRIGETRTLPDKPILCHYGYHGCKTTLNALRGGHIYGPIVEYCEYGGKIVKDKAKFAAQTKTLLTRFPIIDLFVDAGKILFDEVIKIDKIENSVDLIKVRKDLLSGDLGKVEYAIFHLTRLCKQSFSEKVFADLTAKYLEKAFMRQKKAK